MASDADDYNNIEWQPVKEDYSDIEWKPVSQAPAQRDTSALGRIREMGLGVARGMRESIPLAKDISAGTRAYIGNPLTGQRPSGDFAREKETVQRQQRQAEEAAPGSFVAGEIAPYLLPMPKAIGPSFGNLLVKGEEAIASKLAPYITNKTAQKIAAGATTGAGLGAVHGFGEGTDLESRLEGAKSEGKSGAVFGGGAAALSPVLGSVGRVFTPTAAEEAARKLNLFMPKEKGTYIPASISSENPAVKYLSNVLSGLPITKEIMGAGTSKGIASLGEAMQYIPGRYKSMRGTDAGDSVGKSLKDWLTIHSKNEMDTLYDSLHGMFGEQAAKEAGLRTASAAEKAKLGAERARSATVPLYNTQKVFKDILDYKKNAGPAAVDTFMNSEAGKLLAGNLDRSVNYVGAKQLKDLLGNALEFHNPLAPHTLDDRMKQRLYWALKEDTGNIAHMAGGEGAKRRFYEISDEAQKIFDDRKFMRQIVGARGADDVTAAQVYDKFKKMAMEGRSENIPLIKRATRLMDEDARFDLRNGLIDELGADATGVFHPNDFVKKYSKFSDEAKDALFGGAKTPTRQSLENVLTLSKQYSERGKPRSASNWATAISTAAVVGAGIDLFAEGPEAASKKLGAFGIPAGLTAALLAVPRITSLAAIYARNRNPEILKQISALVSKDPALQSKIRTAFAAKSRGVMQGRPVAAQDQDREERASGGRLGNRDYPAKRLSRVERAAKRAMDSIALETKPLMNQPDQVIADALKLASQK